MGVLSGIDTYLGESFDLFPYEIRSQVHHGSSIACLVFALNSCVAEF